ncbi:RDD family protein [Halomonadaceae bacterium KBTZ08]
MNAFDKESPVPDPYQVPASTLTDEVPEGRPLASRVSRLGAAMIDGIVTLLIMTPVLFVWGKWGDLLSGGETSFGTDVLLLIYGVVGYVLVNGYFLHHSGQSLGKKALGIRIENLEGHLIGAPAIIGKRYLPVTFMSMAPGNLFGLIDALFIFRKDRRCIHDMIAGTRVVQRVPEQSGPVDPHG